MHAIKALLTTFDGLYTQQTGARYPVNGGKDSKLVKDLRAIYSDEDIERYMRAFFSIEDEFIAQSGFSLGAFRGCLPKVIAWANRKPRVVTAWHCPHAMQCNDRQTCANATLLDRPRKVAV